ncbi:hypothetical protein BDZ91DRAFT_784394 [Kalaharituber pfeilii]|nr:hypothetical protein BDZ91DRAFT_784394 [Kalaharituber pfeilii]
MARVRRSLQEIQYLYETGQDKAPLENLVRAFRGVQSLPPDNPDSFFYHAAWHGEPFRGPGATDQSWWGGYCNHANVLFPTWHRVLLLELENSMRKVPGCEDVTLPYWDEYVELPSIGTEYPVVIPKILTEREFPLDGRALREEVIGADNRYTKPEGYETVRFPYSGLVGTAQDREHTRLYNAQYAYPENVRILNTNVANWLKGTHIEGDGQGTPTAVATSIRRRLWHSLMAPNYTVFSNTTSQNQWMKDHGKDPSQDPFYEGVYDANPELRYLGANGDMGCNETASFDPIFYMHHCFIDYMMWKWQELHNCTEPGSLGFINGYAGTIITDPVVGLPPGTILDMHTPLYPFMKPDGQHYTSADVVDITTLGYTYGPGSIDAALAGRNYLDIRPEPPALMKRVHNINRAEYKGSFVIKTYAQVPGVDRPLLIGSEPILSGWNVEGCANCQNKLEVESVVPLEKATLAKLLGGSRDPKEIQYSVVIKTFDREIPYIYPTGDDRSKMPVPPSEGFVPPPDEGRRQPLLDDLF